MSPLTTVCSLCTSSSYFAACCPRTVGPKVTSSVSTYICVGWPGEIDTLHSFVNKSAQSCITQLTTCTNPKSRDDSSVSGCAPIAGLCVLPPPPPQHNSQTSWWKQFQAKIVNKSSLSPSSLVSSPQDESVAVQLLTWFSDLDSPPNGWTKEDDLFIMLHRLTCFTSSPLVAALLQILKNWAQSAGNTVKVSFVRMEVFFSVR